VSVKETLRRHGWLVGLALVVYFFLLGPIAVVVASAFSPKSTLDFPPGGFSFKWFEKAFAYPPFQKAFITSLEVAVLATLLALAIGVPAALAIQRHKFRGKDALQNFFLSPVIVPEIVLGLALLQQVMVVLHIDVLWALILGHAVILTPYAVRVTGASLTLSNPAVEEAARGLGAGPLTTFFRITLPIIQPGIIAASVLSFITSFNNVPLSLFLTGPGVSTLPIQMFIYVEFSFDPTVAAISAMILVLTVVFALVAERLVGLKNLFAR